MEEIKLPLTRHWLWLILKNGIANGLAMQAGKPELDFSIWDENKERYIAAIHAGLEDCKPMEELVRLASTGGGIYEGE